MATKRDFLKKMGFSALALPTLSEQLLSNPLVTLDQLPSSLSLPLLPAAGDPQFWTKIREQFMLSHDSVFFNTGTLGATPRVVVARMVEHLHFVASHIAGWDYSDHGGMISGYAPMVELRGKIAQLLNADVTEISLTENVTSAMSYVADGLDLARGDEILTSNQEHPGGRSAWLVKEKRSGVTYREIPLPKPAQSPEEILEVVTKAFRKETRVLVLSHVITGSGAILPVKEICAAARDRGIFTVLDGAQAVGHVPVALHDIGCDAYVGCFHKWLLAPAGNGFLYLRREQAERIWTTLASSEWANHQDDGFRFTQRGTGSMTLLLGLEAALDFHAEIGHEKILARIKYLGNCLRDGLRNIKKVKIYSPSDENLCAGITVYNLEGWTGPRLQEEFWKRDRLRPRSSSDVYGLRQSTHIYNSPEEVERSLRIVRELAGS
jgi:isopenicillin-N epimerase